MFPTRLPARLPTVKRSRYPSKSYHIDSFPKKHSKPSFIAPQLQNLQTDFLRRIFKGLLAPKLSHRLISDRQVFTEVKLRPLAGPKLVQNIKIVEQSLYCQNIQPSFYLKLLYPSDVVPSRRLIVLTIERTTQNVIRIDQILHSLDPPSSTIPS